MLRKVLAVLVVFLVALSVILSGCGGATTEPEGEEEEVESGAITFDFDFEGEKTPFDFSLNSRAVYKSNLDKTTVYGEGTGRESIELSFKGTGVGTYESPTAGGRFKYLNFEGRSFTTDDKNHGYKGQYYIINVTAYGAVGEPVEGTFEAVTSTGVGGTGTGGTITDYEIAYPTISGSFSVIRRAEE